MGSHLAEAMCSKISGTEAEFRKFLEYIRPIILENKAEQTLSELHAELGVWLQKTELSATRRQLGMLYYALLKWRVERVFSYPAEGRLQARTQYWELEWNCPVFEFQKLFSAKTFEKFPDLGGFKAINKVYSTVTGTRSSFIDARFSGDVRVHRRAGADKTIVVFTAKDYQFAGIAITLFDRAVAEPLNANLVVFKDFNNSIFLAGLKSVGGFDASVQYVHNLLTEFAHTKIIGMGASSGVFAALNYGARVGIEHVVALAGPTSLDIGLNSGTRPVYKKIFEDHKAGLIDYPDLSKVVAGSSLNRIDFFVGGRNEYDMAQMQYLLARSDVMCPHVYERNGAHVLLDVTLSDGTLFKAINAETA